MPTKRFSALRLQQDKWASSKRWQEMERGARKSTNMVPVDSTEKGGAEVLRVFEAKPCDCAVEQTEANDGNTARRDLGTEPSVHWS